MRIELLAALVVFAFVTSITPGPNNLMLLASGVNFGFRRTLPHMFGVGLGFGFMIMVLGLGLSQVLTRYPIAYEAMRWGGGAYMLWLAWKIAKSGPVADGEVSGTPLTFLQAAAFQWVNPKAWVMGVTAIAAYSLPASYILSVVLIAAVFCLVNIPSIACWAGFGAGLKHWLNDPRYLRPFNVTMAVLLVLSMAPLLWH